MTSPTSLKARLSEQMSALGADLRPFALFGAALLAMLTLVRAALVVWQLERVTAAHMIGTVFLEGLRFDLVLLGFFYLVPVFTFVIFFTSERALSVGRPLLRAYLLLVFGFALFLELATPSFINQYDARPNRIFFEYLIYPKEVGGTLLAGYLPQLAGALVLILVVLLLLGRRLGRAFAATRRVHVVTALVAVPVLLVACVMAMRSTLEHRAVNPSTVARSTDPMVNDLALNSAYTVLYAAIEEKAEPEGGFRYGSMSTSEAVQRVKAAMQIPAEDFVPGDIPTLHRQTATAAPARPKNLVIVLEESLGAEFVGALGGLPLTPRLDELSHEGLWLANLYATGTRSVRGLEALITGFTPTPAESVVKLGRSQRGFFTIARVLRAAGYDTSFIYAGETQFDNMRRFFMNNGFESVIGEDDYENPVFRGSWGVSDEDLFTRADAEFSKPHERPFFTLVFTTSNHSPYEFPDGRIELYDPAHPNTVANAVKYADYALGQFFDRARTRPYWNDTVFLVVADHNSRVYGASLVPVEHFHIPGLILGGGIEPKVYEPVASQIDMPPTLLSLIGVSSVHPMIGHDLTLPKFAAWPGRAIMQYENTQGYMLGKSIVILRKNLPPAEFLYDGHGSLAPTAADPDLVATAIAHATWTSVTYEEQRYRLPGGDAPEHASGAPQGGDADPQHTE
ncbi:MAG TPA: LTA synthase family protein [Gammaproteobacteria bacterium]|nr:LTA synthase family protein [Gammaproteobacteria bacterium]